MNQQKLYQTSEKLAADEVAISEEIDCEILHGRITKRQVKVYSVPEKLRAEWSGATSIVAVTRSGSRWEGKHSRRKLVDFHEQHYYLSSLDYSATQFASAIRGHWLIENRLHWVKDVTLNEDNCIHRGGHSPANWAMIRQFLLSLARMNFTRTLPAALRLMANDLEQQSKLLFGLNFFVC